MPYSINIRSDHESSNLIRMLWDKSGKLESEPSMRSLNYPPHLTLAVYEDLDRSALIDTIDAVAELTKIIAIRFDKLSYFDAPNAIILWARPVSPTEVIRLHERIHNMIGPQLSRPNYRPGAWVPHCTLATAIDQSHREEAIELTHTVIEPFEVTFNMTDCAYFHPIEVLHERVLATGDA